jgi:hypothetical protein
VTNRDDSPWRAGAYSATDSRAEPAQDVLESGGRAWPALRWRPPRLAVALALAGLVVGFGAGYLTGHRSAPRRPLPGVPAALTLTQAGSQCSTQNGHYLELGVQVTNATPATATLHKVHVILPLGGLSVFAWSWTPCGELPDPAGAGTPGGGTPGGMPVGTVPATAPIGARRLAPGATTWLTVTFRVLVHCPAPLPVEFAVAYDQRGTARKVHLPGFSDLGNVPYAGCPGRFPTGDSP